MANDEAGRADADVQVARGIILGRLKGYDCRVFLFGSRAARTESRSSDLDVAVLPARPLPLGLLAEISEALEESSILLSVDLVDLSRCDGAFRERVIEGGVPWAA